MEEVYRESYKAKGSINTPAVDSVNLASADYVNVSLSAMSEQALPHHITSHHSQLFVGAASQSLPIGFLTFCGG